jgi:tetrahydromethanopterin S-methyltransferase subunit G
VLLANTTYYSSQKIDKGILYGLVDVGMTCWMLTSLIVNSDMTCSEL